MKTLKPAHITFINGIITHGNQARAYREAYPRSSYAAAKANASRLMKNNRIRQHIERYNLMADLAVERECKERKKEILTSFLDRRETYWHIAAGHPVQTTNASGQIIMSLPSLTERLAAMGCLLREEKAFLKKYPQHAAWLEEITTEHGGRTFFTSGGAFDALQPGAAGREQRLSFYLKEVPRQSLYSTAF